MFSVAFKNLNLVLIFAASAHFRFDERTKSFIHTKQIIFYQIMKVVLEIFLNCLSNSDIFEKKYGQPSFDFWVLAVDFIIWNIFLVALSLSSFCSISKHTKIMNELLNFDEKLSDLSFEFWCNGVTLFLFILMFCNFIVLTFSSDSINYDKPWYWEMDILLNNFHIFALITFEFVLFSKVKRNFLLIRENFDTKNVRVWIEMFDSQRTLLWDIYECFKVTKIIQLAGVFLILPQMIFLNLMETFNFNGRDTDWRCVVFLMHWKVIIGGILFVNMTWTAVEKEVRTLSKILGLILFLAEKNSLFWILGNYIFLNFSVLFFENFW